MQIKKQMMAVDPDGYKQEVLGMFVDFQGDVFPTYDEETFFGKVEYNPNLPTEASIDYGTRAPFACVFIQKRGRFVRCFRLYYKTGLSSLDNALALKPLFKKYNVHRCTIDPAAEDTRLILQKIIPKCSFVKGINDIIPGYNVLRDHLHIEPESGKPLIMFDESMKDLKKEFKLIHYPKGEKEVPVDRNNHALAALRYYLLKYCNFLNRQCRGHIRSFGRESQVSSYIRELRWSGGSAASDVKDRPWMGGVTKNDLW